MTANLQITVKQAATMMGVSERSVYMAMRVKRLRPDLFEHIGAGEISLNKALAIIESKPKPTTYDKLLAAWNSATDQDRERLLAIVLSDGES